MRVDTLGSDKAFTDRRRTKSIVLKYIDKFRDQFQQQENERRKMLKQLISK